MIFLCFGLIHGRGLETPPADGISLLVFERLYNLVVDDRSDAAYLVVLPCRAHSVRQEDDEKFTNRIDPDGSSREPEMTPGVRREQIAGT